MNRQLRSFVFVVLFILRLMRGRLQCLKNLPLELQFQIFLRLPTRSLLVIRCVCKSFRAITQRPTFIQAHLARISFISTSQNSLILNFGDHPDDFPYHLKSQQFFLSLEKNTRKLLNCFSITPPIPIVYNHIRLFVVGSVNGLICFGIRFNERVTYKSGKILFFLWNPVIGQCRYLPSPKYTTLGNLFQFCFVSETNDYVVLKIESMRQFCVEVYKMSNDAWTTIDCSSFPIAETLIRSIYLYGNFVFFKGSFHWPARNSSIVYCNIKNENLDVMKTVDNERVLEELTRHEDRVHIIYKVAVIDESLATIYWNIGVCNILEIWVMEEYGLENSWTQKLKIVEDVGKYLYPVGYWTDGLMITDQGIQQPFQLYDLRAGGTIRIPEMESIKMEVSGFDFVETLAPVRYIH